MHAVDHTVTPIPPWKISILEEMEIVARRLKELGQSAEHAAVPIESFKDASPNPMAKHKIVAAKKRKAKRKTGGPR